MIDIDIVEQLVPNPLTMIVQLCSTLVLFLLMKKLLWKSVKNWLAARSEKMQEDITISENAKQEALLDREKAHAQLSEAGNKSEEIVNAAVKEANSQRAQILEDANKEAENLRKKAHEQIEAEKRAAYSDMQKEMVDVAMSAAGKILSEEDAERLDAKAIEAFVKEATNDAE